MPKWEYRRFRTDSEETEDIMVWLNKIGQQGWEVISNPVLTGNGIVAWAKRPVK